MKALKGSENLFCEWKAVKDIRKGHKIFFSDPVIDSVIVLWPVGDPDILFSTRMQTKLVDKLMRISWVYKDSHIFSKITLSRTEQIRFVFVLQTENS